MKLRSYAIIFLIWTLLAFPYASHLYVYLTTQGFKTTWAFQLIEALAATYTWALLTPLVLQIANKHPLLPFKPLKFTAHLLSAFGISLLQVIIHTLTDGLLVHWNEPLQFLDRFSMILSRTYFFNLIIYALILCLHTSFDFYKRKQLEDLLIRAQIAESELKLLKNQLQPHFLFNTLNTIVALIYQDPEKAHIMISKLSQLLRMTLEFGTEHTITLQQELELVRTYVEIEKVRFQNRLNVEYEIDSTLSHVQIPCMILQPLIENSIRHRVAHDENGTNIKIIAAQADEHLWLSVRDYGSALSGLTNDKSTGIGLNNMKLRLEKLYGDKAQLKIDQLPTNGFEVKIVMPIP
jgi:sensor histidine kinase YesM